MSQNDFTIADQSFPNFRADLNLALQALASLSSGATAPTVPFANQLWYETDTNTLWIRNELNTAWLDLLRIDQTTGSPSFMSGNVGIGTTAPARALHVKNTNPSIRLEDTDGGVSTIYAEIDGTQSGSLFLKADPGNASAGSNIQFEIDASEKLRIGPLGQIGIAGANYGTAGQPIVSGGSGATVAFGPLLSNGTYTPTLTAVTNVAASTANACQWLRVGNTVTVSGSVAVTATAVSTDTEIGISIPVASNFARGANVGGTGASTST